jgi:hypothetical protein
MRAHSQARPLAFAATAPREAARALPRRRPRPAGRRRRLGPAAERPIRRGPAFPGMVPGPEKVDVKRAADDKAKLAMLRELAKQAKPIGVEKKDEGKPAKKK